MTGPREWRHAKDCGLTEFWADRCYCGLSAVRDAIDQGHRVVIGPEGVEGRLEWRGCCDDPECVRNDERHLIPMEPPVPSPSDNKEQR